MYDFNVIDDYSFEEFSDAAGSEEGQMSWDEAIELLQNTFSLAEATWKHIQHAVYHAQPSQTVDIIAYVLSYRLAHLAQETGSFDLFNENFQQAFDVVRQVDIAKPTTQQVDAAAFQQFIEEGRRIVSAEKPVPMHTMDLGPCPYGPSCLMRFVDVHGDHIKLVCAKPLSCPHTGDPAHTRQYLHICPRLAGCDELGREHFALFKHRQQLCPHELNHVVNPVQNHPCTHDPRDVGHFAMYLHRCTVSNCHEVNYYAHLMRFWHPLVHKIQRTLPTLEEAVLTYRDFVLEVDLTTMINPIKQWRFSPRHPVFINGSNGATGVLIGSYANTDWSESTTMLVELKDGTAAHYNLNDLSSTQANTNSPLSDASVKVWRSPSTTAAMTRFLSSEMMPGKTAAQALKVITDANIPVYIMGGAVRDLAEGKDISAIKDIDLAFGCSPQELNSLLKRNGISSEGVRTTGLLRFGALTSPYLEMEGKSMLNFFASNSTSVLTRDVSLDVMGKDLSINSLYYDVLNNAIIDPSGNGIQDLARKVLRPPCRDALWSVWMGDNPSKIGRLIEFMIRRPDYTLPDGLVQVARAFLHDQGNMQNCTSKIPGWYTHRLAIKPANVVQEFTRIAKKEFGYDFATATVI